MTWLQAALASSFWLALTGCAALLGIEEAVCDTDFDPACDPDRIPTDAGGDAASAAPHAQLCARYCDAVTDACQGDAEQYQSEESCNEICDELMLSGTQMDGALTGNTVECRLNAALAAQSAGEVESNCATAGMFGNFECGTPCEAYCSLLEAACKSEFDVFDDCERECEAIPVSDELFSSNIEMGDTLQCRVYHIRLATSARRPDVHCPHAVGQGICE